MVRWPPSGIASRVDSKVEHSVLELIGIGMRPPQHPSKHDFQLNVCLHKANVAKDRADRKQLVDFERLGMEGQLMGEG